MAHAPRELGRYISDEQPFGPIATERVHDREVLDYLFESDNEFNQEAARVSPTIVVGRRGSGKTAFLLASKTQDGSRGIRINTHDVFASVSAVVRALIARNTPYFVGHVADLWEAALWHCVMAELTAQPPAHASDSRVGTLRNYLLALTPDPWDDTRCDALKAFCRELPEQFESAGGNAA